MCGFFGHHFEVGLKESLIACNQVMSSLLLLMTATPKKSGNIPRANASKRAPNAVNIKLITKL